VIPSCSYIKKAVENYKADLERVGDSDFPYVFDRTKGNNVIKFFERGLIQYRDEFANKLFILADWQKFAIHQIYSWRHKKTGNRRYRYAYIEVGRKNGKSSWAAGIALYELLFDKHAPEIYCAATGRKQARIVLDEARKIARKSREINGTLHIREHDIVVPATNGRMEAITANSDKLDGLGPSLSILDELHAHKSFGLFNVFDTTQGARSNPLLLSISTAGLSKAHPAYAYRKYLVDVLEGRIIQENTFSLIFATDPEDDWKSELALRKANPSWGISVDPEYLLRQLQKAKSNPTFETDYRSKHLNEWVDAERAWISDAE
jgi:phage terminase large subunit-like protein